MGKALSALGDLISSTFDAIVDVVRTIWQDAVVPILGEVFGVFGINDETIIDVNKVSIAVLSDKPNKIVKNAQTKAVLGLFQNDAGFYKNYFHNFNKHKREINSYYNYGKGGNYVYGLPHMEIHAADINHIDVNNALNTQLDGIFTVLTATTAIPDAELFFKHKLQASPYHYLPYNNTLIKAAENGILYNDWRLDTVIPKRNVIIEGNTTTEYELSVSRRTDISQFGIETAQNYVNEGDTVELTVTLNRAVPYGATLRVNLTYSGALSSEFNAPSYVDILAEDVSAVVEITDVSPAQAKRLTISASINPTTLFESLTVWEPKRETSVVLVPTGVVALCMGQQSVKRGDTVTVPVTLSGDVPGGFTVDWTTVDLGYFGAAAVGDDFNTTTGTLSFTGNKDETKTVSVATFGVYSFFPSEPFEIALSLPSNNTVVHDVNGLVRITNDAVPLPYTQRLRVTEVILDYYHKAERYLVATYHEASAPKEEWFYWLYRFSDLTLPNTELTTTTVSNLDMLPVAILRKNKQSISTSKNLAQNLYEDFGVDTEVYKSTRNLLKRIGLRVDDVIDAIEANPDVDVIDDAYVNFAVSPSDTNRIVSKLIWLHMYELIVERSIASNDGKYSATFEEQDVNNALVWSAHKYTKHLSIYSGDFIKNPANINFLDMEVGEYSHYVDNNALWLIKKTSEFSVEEIQVVNLSGMNAIAYDGYHNMSFNKASYENFTIPVSWYVLNKLRGPEVIEVFPYIFRVDIFSINVTELDWYETENFRTAFEVIMLVISVYTLGQATSVYQILANMLAQYAISQIVIYIAELTGNTELAAIVGIVASIVVGSRLGVSYDLTTADGLSATVTAFSSSLSAAQSVELKELQSDLDDLMDEFEKQKEFQEENSYSSDTIGGASYWSLKSSDTNMYEGRELQYNFDLLFDYDNIISNFYDQQLTVSSK